MSYFPSGGGGGLLPEEDCTIVTATAKEAISKGDAVEYRQYPSSTYISTAEVDLLAGTDIPDDTALSANGDYLVCAYEKQAPYARVYKRVGDTYDSTGLVLDSLNQYIFACSVSADGRYIVLFSNTAPHLMLYKTTDFVTWYKLANTIDLSAHVTAGPSQSNVQISPDATAVALTFNTSVSSSSGNRRLFLYNIIEDTMVQMVYKGSDGVSNRYVITKFTDDSRRIFIFEYYSGQKIHAFYNSGTSITLEATNATILTGTWYYMQVSGDGKTIAGLSLDLEQTGTKNWFICSYDAVTKTFTAIQTQANTGGLSAFKPLYITYDGALIYTTAGVLQYNGETNTYFQAYTYPVPIDTVSFEKSDYRTRHNIDSPICREGTIGIGYSISSVVVTLLNAAPVVTKLGSIASTKYYSGYPYAVYGFGIAQEDIAAGSTGSIALLTKFQDIIAGEVVQ